MGTPAKPPAPSPRVKGGLSLKAKAAAPSPRPKPEPSKKPDDLFAGMGMIPTFKVGRTHWPAAAALRARTGTGGPAGARDSFACALCVRSLRARDEPAPRALVLRACNNCRAHFHPNSHTSDGACHPPLTAPCLRSDNDHTRPYALRQPAAVAKSKLPAFGGGGGFGQSGAASSRLGAAATTGASASNDDDAAGDDDEVNVV
jgi:hypothetical protein